MKVAIFGTGYVGLVTGSCLADVGCQVTCVDIDKDKIKQLQQGVIPIYERGLEAIVHRNIAEERLIFTTDAKLAVQENDIIFIAVGTPSDENGACDLSFIIKVAKTVGQYLESEKIVINKSTVPVGTAKKVTSVIQSELSVRQKKTPFHVISNPEFLKEGDAVNDFMKPDRIIIGVDSDSQYVQSTMKALYAPFNRMKDKVIFMDVISAELTKYAANAMLATKISFMNELSNIAERAGADIEMVRQGIGSDPRIGYQFIYPGCGYGGSCFPKDMKALVQTSEAMGYKPEILKAVENVNSKQKNKLLDYIRYHYPNGVKGKCFAMWGLSFKPNTDDIREAPSIVIIKALIEQGAMVQAYDPKAMDEIRKEISDDSLVLCKKQNDCLVNANALIICTEWQSFRSPDTELFKSHLSDSVVFDGRNIYSPELMDNLELCYYGIGRGKSMQVHTVSITHESQADELALN